MIRYIAVLPRIIDCNFYKCLQDLLVIYQSQRMIGRRFRSFFCSSRFVASAEFNGWAFDLTEQKDRRY